MQSITPLVRYEQDVASGTFQQDSEQLLAVKRLDDLYHRLVSDVERQKGLLPKIKKKLGLTLGDPIKGLYFWGGVGRGKTYLMDLFFDALPLEKKLRTHFHRFMRSVHKQLAGIKHHSDPLELVADKFSSQYRVICFDEFFVVDITDAMILAGLLDGLFRRGVTLVATSNIKPSGLYENGLQRVRFLPAIDLLEKFTEVVNVDGGIDYRLRTLKQSQLYFFPLGEESFAVLERSFDRLAGQGSHTRYHVNLEVEGRMISALRESDGLVWFDFNALCDGPRSQNDYIELAREYHTVLLSGVPELGERNDDQVRRFIYLVDEFYDRGVKLVIAAAKPLNELYSGERFEFLRTQSRLQEMQSEEYLASAHRG